MFSAITARRPMSRIVLATSRSNHHTSLMVVVPVFSISIACIIIGQSPCARLETQICGLDVLVVDQLLPTLQNDLAGLQHVGMVGELEAVMDVLVDEKNGDPALVQPFDNLEHVRDDERSQSQTRLVQHEETRAAHERPAQRQHLTLAARQRARGLALTLTEDRKQLEDLSASLIHTRPGPTAV